MNRNQIVKQFSVWEQSAYQYQRFGQWFLNTYFRGVSAPEIFYCENPRKALNMIVADSRFCDDAWMDKWATQKLQDLEALKDLEQRMEQHRDLD